MNQQFKKLKEGVTMEKKKYIYFFGDGKAEGRGDMKDLLGGKGAGLAEMTNTGVPVPPGFTITTEVCRMYYSKKRKILDDLSEEIDKNLKRIGKIVNCEFGSEKRPLLLSVRSGAKFSMPGMMDTILNLGLNEKTLKGLIERTKNERFAYDSYRRFIQMFGKVVLNIDSRLFEEVIEEKKQELGVKLDTELDAKALLEIIEKFKKIVKSNTGKEFPEDPKLQLKMAIEAVFKSWMNPRAITYRRLNEIPEDLGTAVNVQAMVFGNLGNNSGTGVGFTRNPATGEKTFYGEYLLNAQGEDVVAGIRTPKHIMNLEKEMPEVYKQLKEITTQLEKHYRDVQDFEFTIQDGKLFMLQTRVGKRTGIAAIRIAVDMVEEGLITKEEAISRVEPSAIEQMLHPIFDPAERAKYKPVAKGLPASPGAACGMVVFNADDAVSWAGKNKKVILVRMETSPDDIEGMHVAQGVLTATGGMTSHAAVVGRQMGKPSVVGCTALKVNEKEKFFEVGEQIVKEGDFISIDGTTGEVIISQIQTSPSEVIQVVTGKLDPKKSIHYKYFKKILDWADEIKKLGIRANADIPRDARIAIALGAKGIGLCRTEHMFFAEDRLPIMQNMILAKDYNERKKYLDLLLPMQKEDFKGIFKAMAGYPVTIRLLDPPLHEFLPKRENLMVEIAKLEITKKGNGSLEDKKKLLSRVEELHEFNPMLGLRGCRLGLTMPEVSEMQVRAIMEAACEVQKEGIKVFPEIMIPLTTSVKEMKLARQQADSVAQEILKKYGEKVKYLIGTMIETPRAAVTADEIAQEADFFSFGTNDLTQMTYAFSRDDAVKFLKFYLDKGILEKDPFQTLDKTGVGSLVKIGVEKGRKTKKELKVGICGEHGGDPASIEFCHQIGMNYVSCSPYRIPVARLAAAHAFLKEKLQMKEKDK